MYDDVAGRNYCIVGSLLCINGSPIILQHQYILRMMKSEELSQLSSRFAVLSVASIFCLHAIVAN
jgi:hypothetical protein